MMCDEDELSAIAEAVERLFHNGKAPTAIKHMAQCGLTREDALFVLTKKIGLPMADARGLISAFYPEGA